MHLTLNLVLLLLLLGFSPVLGRSIRAIIEEIPEKIDDFTADDNMTVSAIIEKANRNIGKLPLDPVLQFGDILVDNGLKNADQCLFQNPGCKWPKSTDGNVYIPYYISPYYRADEKNYIEAIMKTFDSATCIRFTPRQNEESFIYIHPYQGCFSAIGRTGAVQVLSLGRDYYATCLRQHIIQHELLHALGFHHEQNRIDRDQHIKILYENIERGMESQFLKQNTNNLETPYDYASIMHYETTAFTKNGQPTMVPIPNPNVAVGRSTEMNANDILRVKKVYCGVP